MCCESVTFLKQNNEDNTAIKKGHWMYIYLHNFFRLNMMNLKEAVQTNILSLSKLWRGLSVLLSLGVLYRLLRLLLSLSMLQF